MNTNLTWDKALSVVLLQIYGSQSTLKLSPFEILYDRPLQVSAQARESINSLKDLAVDNFVKTLGTIITYIHTYIYIL